MANTKKFVVKNGLQTPNSEYVDSSGSIAVYIRPDGSLAFAGSLVVNNQLTVDTVSALGLSGQAAEATSLMINGSGVVGTRELGSNAFTSSLSAYSTSNLTEGSNLYYTNVRVSANGDVTANTSARHTHANKAILDDIEQPFTNVDNNKLDGIDSGANLYTHPATHPWSILTSTPTTLAGYGITDDLLDSADAINLVTYESLDGNGDVGTGASQVARGNHTHSYNPTIGTDSDLSLSGNEVVSAITVTDGVITSASKRALSAADIGAQPSGTYNTIIGIDSDINTNAAQVIDTITFTDGVVQGMGFRQLTLANLGYTGDADATNYSSADFDTDFSSKSTTNLSEGTNKYYTEVRVSANSDVAANTTARHTHANKAILDDIEQPFTNVDNDKLDGIDSGANLYVHPSDGVDPGAALTGANVFSDITVNAAGHVTGTSTRALTPANIGAQPSGTYNTVIGTDSDISLSGNQVMSSITVTDGVITAASKRVLTAANIGAQPAGTYNTTIGTDSDINTNGAQVIDAITMTDGVIQAMGFRTLSTSDINAEPADGTILKQADVDDTPVNGVTTAPVSSNWAFDHAADTTAHGGPYNNYSHPNHSGHVTSTGDGATVVTVSAITGQTALTSGLVSTDELLVSDNGVIKRMDVSVVQTYMQNNLTFLTGNQTITLDGDVSGSGTTTITTTVADNSHNHTVSNISDAGNLAALNTVGTAQIDNNAVTWAKTEDMAQNTILGRITASTGDPQELTAANVRTIINVADGANAYTHPDHTGHVTSAADGATVVTVSAITGQTATASIVSTDEILVNDGGAIRRADVSVLETYMQSNLDFAASSHNHTIANVTGLQAELDNKIDRDSSTDIAGTIRAEGLEVQVFPGTYTPVYTSDNPPPDFNDALAGLRMRDDNVWVAAPTTLAGYGITDAAGGTGTVDQSTLIWDSATQAYIENTLVTLDASTGGIKAQRVGNSQVSNYQRVDAGNAALGSILGDVRWTHLNSLTDNVSTVAQIQAKFDGSPALAPTDGSSPGALVFRTADSDATTPSDRMIINSVGNVGIGTLLPDKPLHVIDEILVERTGTPSTLSLYRENPTFIIGGTQIGRIRFRGDISAGALSNGAIISSEAPDLWSGTSTPGDLTFNTTAIDSVAATESMRITSEGLVGINTFAPDEELHVIGDIKSENTTATTIILKRDAGAPTTSGLTLGRLAWQGVADSNGNSGNSARLAVFAEEDFDSSQRGAGFVFEATETGTNTLAEKMRISGDGIVTGLFTGTDVVQNNSKFEVLTGAEYTALGSSADSDTIYFIT